MASLEHEHYSHSGLKSRARTHIDIFIRYTMDRQLTLPSNGREQTRKSQPFPLLFVHPQFLEPGHQIRFLFHS